MSGIAPPLLRKLALLAIALLIALLMLPNLAWLAHDPGWPTWSAALLLPLALMAVLFALLGRWVWLACLLLVPFAVLAPLETYYVAQYHHPTSAQIIATIIATNPLEAREYFGHLIVPLVLALLAALAVALLAAWASFRADLRWRGPARISALCLGVIVALVPLAVGYVEARHQPAKTSDSASAPLHVYGDAIEDGFPFGVVPRIVEYRREWNRMRTDAAKFKAFRFHAQRVRPPLHQRQVYVLVIGESSRRANWQLFGYDRATNPELSKLSNVVPMTHFITTWPESIAAIPMILTRRKPDMAWDAPWHEASILRAMQEAGYETWWISNQQAIGEFDSPVSMYAYEAEHVEWLNHASWTAPGSYDGDLVQPLKDALHASDKDLFIVLHMMGSHVKYDYRYPPAFEHWKPTQVSPPGQGSTIERVRNSYDNTILYTDHVLAQVIDALKQSGAVTALWFESDHGELIPTPTCDKEGHGVGTVAEYEIPALFWYSNAYQQHFPQRVAALRANAGKRTLSADTFESLIDMAGVTFPSHDETWSLFSPAWHYHTRWVAQTRHIDFDTARFDKTCQRVLPGTSGSADDDDDDE
ncbi:MAG: Lipid A phosphoethanolamine transferase, putative [Rhodanobacteraceae bacterium]|jgi:glucan phosphoethanolaminetransferase (alkaline phosphatase superfamily)|nr:MAG: Lipid A phosphoethanolamine transferase, putative [Rhodanobacteraceae bacterium]